jgi:uncharacterized protein YcfJ
MSEQFSQPGSEMGNDRGYSEFSEDEETGTGTEADNPFHDSEPSPYAFDDNETCDDETGYTHDELVMPVQSEAELPPEARGEMNGGPLGCCMGMTIGILVCFAIGLVGLGQVTANILVALIHADALTDIRVATGFFTVIGAVVGGFVGWKIGKRIYREYDMSARQQERLARLNEKALQRTQLKQ